MALSLLALAASVNAQDYGPLRVTDQVPATLLPAGAMMLDSQQAKSGPVATYAPGGCNPCDSGCGNLNCGSSCRRESFGLFGEALYLRVRNADVAYAIPVDGLGDEALPIGPTASVRGAHDWAYRFGVLYSPTDSVTFRAQYFNYNSHSNGSTVAPEGGILRSLVTHPNALNNAEDSLTAAAQLDHDLRLIDVDTLVVVADRGPFTLSAFTGVRYAELKQGFSSQFEILGTTDVRTSSNFYGIGPRIGLETQLGVRGGLSSYAKTSANFLVGNFSAEYLQSNVFQAQLVNTTFRKSRIVTNLDLELGVAWTGLNDHVTISGGYLISSWYNVVSPNGVIQAVQQTDFTNNRDNLRDNITFDGFVVRLEVRF